MFRSLNRIVIRLCPETAHILRRSVCRITFLFTIDTWYVSSACASFSAVVHIGSVLVYYRYAGNAYVTNVQIPVSELLL